MEKYWEAAVLAAILAGWWGTAVATSSSDSRERDAPPGATEQQRGGTARNGILRRSYLFAETGKKIEYSVFVSSKVDVAKKSPLVIALHGMDVPPRVMLRDLTQAAEEGGYIVAAPMGYHLRGWFGAQSPNPNRPVSANLRAVSEKDVINVLLLMREQFNIDDERIYIVGHSMGGAGALHLGAKYNGVWAAVAAIAPAIPAEDPQDVQNFWNTPVLFVHGNSDQVVPISRIRRWVRSMQGVGIACEYHEIRAGGHRSAVTRGAPHVFAFFDKHSKRSVSH